jgi:hypothetical protein
MRIKLPNIIEAGKLTANGRVYSKELLEKAYGKIQERVKSNGMLLYRPDSDYPHQLSDCVGKVKEADVEKIVIEPIETTESVSLFKTLQDMQKSNIPIHAVPSGRGSLRREGHVDVVEDFEIAHFSFTFDGDKFERPTDLQYTAEEPFVKGEDYRTKSANILQAEIKKLLESDTIDQRKFLEIQHDLVGWLQTCWDCNVMTQEMGGKQ